MPKTATKRVTLTKKHLSTELGAQLKSLLFDIAQDGAITDEEISRLSAWLAAAPREIPAVAHLHDTITDILHDGVLSDEERRLLFRQVERVLPPEEREEVQFARASNEESLPPPWHSDPPTEAQLRFISGLGGTLPPGATKGDASILIDRLLNSTASITPRQRMVLRFWDKTLPPDWGKKHVSIWMDEVYQREPDMLLAWELFKEESGDTGVAQDPERVPIGVGRTYLARVRASRGADATVTKHHQQQEAKPTNLGTVVIIILLVIVAVILNLNT